MGSMRSGAALLLPVAVIAACGGGARRSTVPLGVLPEVWATTAPVDAPPAARRVARSLERSGVTTRAIEGAAPGCLEDLGCLRREGQRLGVRKVLTLKLAELGQTIAVQLSLIDVGRGARETTLRELVREASRPRLEQALDAMAARVARQAGAPETDSSALYWAGAGGLALAVAAVIVVIALPSGDGGEAPDHTIVPP